MRRNPTWFVLVALVLLLAPAPARAERASLERCIESLDGDTVRALTDRLEPRIRANQTRARWWFWGWMATNFGFLVGSTAFAIAEDDPKWRDAYRWGIAGSGATMLTMLIPPLPSAFATRRLGRRSAPDDRAFLARALRLIDAAATQEHAAKAWWTHAASGSFALAQGLYLGLRHDDAVGVAVSNAVMSFAIAEVQAWTSPRAMTRLARELADDDVPCVGAASAARPSLEVSASFGGLSLSVRF